MASGRSCNSVDASPDCRRTRYGHSCRNRIAPPACAGALPYTARVSLPANLDTAWGYPSATGRAGKHAATVRDNLFPKGAFSLEIRGAGRAPVVLRDRKPPACAEGSSLHRRGQLPADLNTAWGQPTTTGSSALNHPASVRDILYPKGAFSLVVRVAAGAAQCI